MTMTPARFTECRELIGWDRKQLARMLGCSDNTLRQMETGKQAVTAPLAAWLERLARYHARNPAPENWRSR
jgi:transcriptional regulator with XRE-family HTH domain